MKSKSISLNFIMNFLLTASSILFPLITFPYVSRVLGPTGTGAVAMGTSLVSYFTMVAMLGIPTYGIRACAKVRDNRQKLSQIVQELLIINLIMALISYLCLLPVAYPGSFFPCGIWTVYDLFSGDYPECHWSELGISGVRRILLYHLYICTVQGPGAWIDVCTGAKHWRCSLVWAGYCSFFIWIRRIQFYPSPETY